MTESTKKAPKKAVATKKPAQHPVYKEMIVQAISALKERNGSSRQKISKYIAGNFTGLGNENALKRNLKSNLKRLVLSGSLLQVKGTGASGSFKLAKTEKAAKKPVAAKKGKKPKAAAAKAKKSPASAKKKAVVAKLPKKSPAKKKPKAKVAKKPVAKSPKKKTSQVAAKPAKKLPASKKKAAPAKKKAVSAKPKKATPKKK